MYSVQDNPVPGIPAVTRVPLGPTVYLNPLGPMDRDAPLLLKLTRKPGNRRTDLRNRNPIAFSRLLGAMILATQPLIATSANAAPLPRLWTPCPVINVHKLGGKFDATHWRAHGRSAQGRKAGEGTSSTQCQAGNRKRQQGKEKRGGFKTPRF